MVKNGKKWLKMMKNGEKYQKKDVIIVCKKVIFEVINLLRNEYNNCL
jgi:hypothetical protein